MTTIDLLVAIVGVLVAVMTVVAMFLIAPGGTLVNEVESHRMDPNPARVRTPGG